MKRTFLLLASLSFFLFCCFIAIAAIFAFASMPVSPKGEADENLLVEFAVLFTGSLWAGIKTLKKAMKISK